MNTATTEPLKLRLSRTLDATCERVFQAWTDPDKLSKWFHPDPSIKIISVKADARVGGKYRIQMKKPDGEFFTAVGTYHEIKPSERLVFTFAWEKDGSEPDFGEPESPEMLMTLEFIPHGKQTLFVLTHEKFASVESRDHHEQGWTGYIDSLEKFVK